MLRPGGRVVALEHVRSPHLPVRVVLWLVEVLFGGVEHILREPLDHVRAEGFAVERFARPRLGVLERLVARAPSG